MAKPGESPILVHVHGLRNRTATFDGGPAELLVGAMVGGSYAGDEECVLLTVEGRDAKTGETVDIEIAVPVSQAQELVSRVIDRADIGQ